MDSNEKTHTVSCGSSVYTQDKCLSKHTVSGTPTTTSAVTTIHLLHFQHVAIKVWGDSATAFETHKRCIL